MEQEQLKQTMLSGISQEVAQWAEESQQIKDGYEFEDRLLLRMRTIGKILMEQSVGKVPKSRNQKKTPYLCRRDNSKQSPSVGTDQRFS